MALLLEPIVHYYQIDYLWYIVLLMSIKKETCTLGTQVDFGSTASPTVITIPSYAVLVQFWQQYNTAAPAMITVITIPSCSTGAVLAAVPHCSASYDNSNYNTFMQ